MCWRLEPILACPTVRSYLGFGLMAGRAAVLAWEDAKSGRPQGHLIVCQRVEPGFCLSLARSYLGFGLMAGRAAVLAWEEAKAANPCVLADHQGAYEYGGMKYELQSHPAGSGFEACSKLVRLVLRQDLECGAPQVRLFRKPLNSSPAWREWSPLGRPQINNTLWIRKNHPGRGREPGMKRRRGHAKCKDHLLGLSCLLHSAGRSPCALQQ